MIRVLHVIGSLERGGAENILENVASRQANQIIHVIVALSDQSEPTLKLQESGVRIIRIGLREAVAQTTISGRIVGITTTIIKIVQTIRLEKPDIVQTWMYHSDLIGGLVAKLLRIPVIWGIFLSNLDKAYYKLPTRLIIRVVSRLSRVVPTKIISCTKVGAETHRKIGYPENKIEFIPVGIDSEEYRYSENMRLEFRHNVNCSDSKIIIGMVARWDPQKDYALFFKAAGELSRIREDIEFWLAGGYGITRSNEQLSYLEKINGLDEKVRYFGRLENLVEFYSSLDIFTLTSHGEGLPLVVGEAMSCELPCVVSDVGDVSLLLSGGAGILLENNHSNILVEQWLALISGGRDLWSELGKKARNRICDQYDVQRISDSYVRVYNALVKKPC